MANSAHSEIKSLLSKGEPLELYNFLTNYYDHPKFHDFFTRIISYLLDGGYAIVADQVWMLAGIDPLLVQSADLGILAIRHFLLNLDISAAMMVFLGCKTRKKHLMLIIKWLLSQNETATAVSCYLKYLPGNYRAEAEDLELFLGSEDILDILDYYCGRPCSVSSTTEPRMCTIFDPPYCPDGNLLKLLPFSDSERQELISSISTSAGRVITPFLGTKISYVIDVANVLYHGQGELNEISYKQLDLMIQHLLQSVSGENIVLVAHQRHYKKISKWSTKINIQQTPRGMNDDWFAIVTAITYPGAYLISNDKFRDHITLDNMSLWCAEYLISYEICSTYVIIHAPCLWSVRVQKDDKNYYIPRKDGRWIYINKK